MSMESCQKGPTRHAYAWQIGPFWQDILDVSLAILTEMERSSCWQFGPHWGCWRLSNWQPFSTSSDHEAVAMRTMPLQPLPLSHAASAKVYVSLLPRKAVLEIDGESIVAFYLILPSSDASVVLQALDIWAEPCYNTIQCSMSALISAQLGQG